MGAPKREILRKGFNKAMKSQAIRQRAPYLRTQAAITKHAAKSTGKALPILGAALSGYEAGSAIQDKLVESKYRKIEEQKKERAAMKRRKVPLKKLRYKKFDKLPPLESFKQKKK